MSTEGRCGREDGIELQWMIMSEEVTVRQRDDES